MLPREVWRPVPGYEGRYKVSNQGRVYTAGVRPGMRRPERCRGRERRVDLWDAQGRSRHWFVHQLVAHAFLGPPPTPRHQINHRDGNRDNNAVTNVEWVTPSENRLHACRVLGKGRGSRNGRAKLTEAQARRIKQRLARGDSLGELARAFGVSHAAVWLIRTGKNWPHV